MINKHIPLALLLVFGIGCKAQNGLKTKEVFMYKNGYTYVHNSGNVTTTDGSWSLAEKEIPDALFGTIWFQSSNGIQYILRQIDTIEKAVAMPELELMLKAGKGKKVKLTISTESSAQFIEGVVQQVFEENKDKARYTTNPAIAVIRTATGDVVLYRNTIARVLFAEFENGTDFKITEKTPEARLSVLFKDKTKTPELNMVYVEKHEAWAPVYRLELQGDKKAHLTLGAEIRAGKLDISGASLNLVVAAPAIFSPYLPSYLTGKEGWNEYSDEVANSVSRVVGNSGIETKEDVMVDVSGSKAEDYHVYSIKNFSLQKQQTAYVQILENDVELTHTYECFLPSVNQYTNVGDQDPTNPVNQAVYHWVKFKNPAKQPLTAAPVFVEGVNPGGGNLVLGQPVMNTAAVGAEARIQIAQSLNIPVVQTEVETSRVENERVINVRGGSYSFDLITVQSTMHLENQGDKEVTLILKRNIQGKPLKSDLDWQLVSRPPMYGSPNSNNDITWEVKLKPGEKRNVVYTFQYYSAVN